jgi:hypothetical protein
MTPVGVVGGVLNQLVQIELLGAEHGRPASFDTQFIENAFCVGTKGVE